MVKNLYIDNFKGFQDTYLLLKDVNFLVGENSTGKTSIINLINLISDYSFQINTDFRKDNFDLGTFSDLVSLKSKNRDYFNIGFFDEDCKINDKNTEKRYASLIKFINNDETPIIGELRFLTKKHDVSVILKNKEIYYKATSHKYINNEQITPMDIIKNWIANPAKLDDSYKAIKEKIPSTKSIALLIIIRLVNIHISKGDKHESGLLDLNDYIQNWLWFAPIRAKPQKTYDNYLSGFSPEGEHIPYLLYNLFRNKDSREATKILEKLRKFGKESGLFNNISTQNYGNSKDSPFSLNVDLDGKILKISNVGYGLSQILPIIIEMIRANKHSKFAIQQPEIHLHPKAQASLGTLIFDAAYNEKKKFIIETHSDYIIDRFRFNLRNSKDTSSNKFNSQILFFESEDGNNKISSIEIEQNGEYSENQPKSYREFFINEELSNLSFQ